MNSLVSLGTAAAYGYSVVATFIPKVLPQGTANVYFEAAVVIVTLILLGRTLEARAKGRTGAAIQKLLGLQVRSGRRPFMKFSRQSLHLWMPPWARKRSQPRLRDDRK